MAHFRHRPWEGRTGLGAAPERRGPPERRAVSPHGLRRERQGSRRPNGHQGPTRGRRQRARAVVPRHEGGLPAAGRRGQKGLRGPPRRSARVRTRELHPRRYPRRAPRHAGRRPRRERAQAAAPRDHREVHGRVLRNHGGWAPRSDDSRRGRGRRGGRRRGEGARPRQLGEHELPEGPRGDPRGQAGAVRRDRLRDELDQVPRRRARRQRNVARGRRPSRDHAPRRGPRGGRADRARGSGPDRERHRRHGRGGEGAGCAGDRRGRHRRPQDRQEQPRGARSDPRPGRCRRRGDLGRGGRAPRLRGGAGRARPRKGLAGRLRHGRRQQPVHVRPRLAGRRALQRRRRRGSLHRALRPRRHGDARCPREGARGYRSRPLPDRRPAEARPSWSAWAAPSRTSPR